MRDGKFVIPGVPYFSQRLDEDNWQSEGFQSIEEAKHWSANLCGFTCLKMAIKTLFPDREMTLKELLDKGIEIGAYNDKVGAIHSGIVKLGELYGLSGDRESVGDSIEKIARHIQNGQLVIASITVGFEAGKEYVLKSGSKYVMPRGGHLVVIFGVEIESGEIKSFLLHHPSSEAGYEWMNYEISPSDLARSLSQKGNIIYFNTRR
mgnify:CR=1 FL=1